MIFSRALYRELASAAGATFTVLFSVCITWTLIAILGRAAGGRVASGDVVALIAFQSLNYLPTVLTLTSFISVLVVLTRTYRDSEMVVWFASGQSLLRWIRPVLVFVEQAQYKTRLRFFEVATETVNERFPVHFEEGFAKAMAEAGLTGVTVSLTDYRDVVGTYDAVASIEMVEAVGEAYWPAYLDAVARALKPGGRAALQYITIDDAIFDA